MIKTYAIISKNGIVVVATWTTLVCYFLLMPITCSVLLETPKCIKVSVWSGLPCWEHFICRVGLASTKKSFKRHLYVKFLALRLVPLLIDLTPFVLSKLFVLSESWILINRIKKLRTIDEPIQRYSGVVHETTKVKRCCLLWGQMAKNAHFSVLQQGERFNHTRSRIQIKTARGWVHHTLFNVSIITREETDDIKIVRGSCLIRLLNPLHDLGVCDRPFDSQPHFHHI